MDRFQTAARTDDSQASFANINLSITEFVFILLRRVSDWDRNHPPLVGTRPTCFTFYQLKEKCGVCKVVLTYSASAVSSSREAQQYPGIVKALLKCPLPYLVKNVSFFLFCLFLFPGWFSSKKFAPGSSRNDDSHLPRPTASLCFAGLVRSAALRSPQGGAFRAKRRARPASSATRWRPTWRHASAPRGGPLDATDDLPAAPTSVS